MIRGQSSKEAKCVLYVAYVINLQTDTLDSYRHHIICYLCSHIVCWNNIQQKQMLLSILADVEHASKFIVLWPLVMSLSEATFSEDFTELLLSCVDSTVAYILNKTDDDYGRDYWKVFTKLVTNAVEEAGELSRPLIWIRC